MDRDYERDGGTSSSSSFRSSAQKASIMMHFMNVIVTTNRRWLRTVERVASLSRWLANASSLFIWI